MRYLVLLVYSLFFGNLCSQYTISGQVTNERGELLEFGSVFLVNTQYAAVSDAQGNYVIPNVKQGKYTLKATYVGYDPVITEVEVISDVHQDINFKGEIYRLNEIEIQANRTSSKGPFTSSNISKDELVKNNLGQDATFLLQWSPSMVVTSDAGAGIGYTSMRMRGSDQTRINVTLNGVPVNDAESQNVFWVNMPDLAASVSNVQIQRGSGPSTTGAGAFGGTVSINTSELKINPFLEVDAAYGSFGTYKVSAGLGSGLMNNKYSVQGRFSLIHSDGYIDRATADLKSYYFSAARVTPRSSLRLNVFSGQEQTFQAWNGSPEAKVRGDEAALLAHYKLNEGGLYKTIEDSINLFMSDRRYNYYTYENQVDNYRQTHLQLLYSYLVNPKLKTKFTLYYTPGKGYFEEYKPQAKLKDYDIDPVIGQDGATITKSDIVRRRWLDNDLLGIMADMVYNVNTGAELHLGLAVNHYAGHHFGKIIKSSVELPELPRDYHYYDNTGKKSELSGYARWVQQVAERWTFFGDLQVRYLEYNIAGKDKTLEYIDVGEQFAFFNPKVGFDYRWNTTSDLYASIAVASKEPSRGDFIDNAFGVLPKSERLYNTEVGYRLDKERTQLETNLYYMKYKDQLVLTGDLNESGAGIRINVPESYRLGWETSLKQFLNCKWAIFFNATLSSNKINAFDEVIADYTNGFDKVVVHHENTDISFSPSLTGMAGILFRPTNGMEIEWLAKYVGRQYLDNTSNPDRSLDAYHYHNLRISKDFSSRLWKHFTATLQINNILNRLYASNGYTYTYIYEEAITENFLYPQAGINFMLGVHAAF